MQDSDFRQSNNTNYFNLIAQKRLARELLLRPTALLFFFGIHMPTSMMFLLGLAAAVVAVEPGEPLESRAPSTPVVIRHSGKVTRTLRGDWDTPDVVMVAFTTAWPDVLGSLVRSMMQTTDVLVLIPEDERLADATQWFERYELSGGRVTLLDLAVETVWVRDYGPMQTRDRRGDIIWLDADYSVRPADDVVPRLLARQFKVPFESVPEGIEGGAVVSNGAGLCVSTIETFDENAIAVHDQEATDALLQQIGCQVLVLAPALLREQTKHADLFAQFLEPNTVFVASFDPVDAPEDAARMEQAAEMIREAAKSLGQPLKVVRVPHPAPEGTLYYSYINGLRLGRSFLVPEYEGVPLAEESSASAELGKNLPGVELVPVASDEMIDLNGAVHCITLGLELPKLHLAKAGLSKGNRRAKKTTSSGKHRSGMRIR